jgi:DNA processing protein
MQNNYNYHKLNTKDLPERLANIDSPVKQIYYVGQNPNNLINKPCVTIVGSRRPSPYGIEVTAQIARELANKSVVIISGLALGVDSIAHKYCIENGGKTIAVLPCGPDKIYPSTNRNLAKKIIDLGGSIITEYSPDTPALKQNFIIRNRIVSALGDIVIITEAAEKSGTLHTANFALNQGKTVMAVPGKINSPLSAGTNNLIKSGAMLINSVKDILQELKLDTKKSTVINASNPQEFIVLKLIEQGITDGNELQIKSSLEPSIFNQTLTMLEINGQIAPLGNNHWQNV